MKILFIGIITLLSLNLYADELNSCEYRFKPQSVVLKSKLDKYSKDEIVIHYSFSDHYVGGGYHITGISNESIQNGNPLTNKESDFFPIFSENLPIRVIDNDGIFLDPIMTISLAQREVELLDYSPVRENLEVAIYTVENDILKIDLEFHKICN